MAIVYLAHDLKHDRRVAFKVLRPELAHVLGRDRFLREVQTVARLQHPHILPLFDSGETAGQLWFTMPYVEGESLRQQLEREHQLPLDESVRISLNVLSALAYAHAHGIIHRDLKPENILLESGEAVVADFGIAHAVDAAGGEHLTESGLVLGTPAYMSPEQATGRNEVDGRSDIYGFACVLYEMLAGVPPFSGPTPQAVLARHYLDPAPPLRTVRATLPPSLERVIVKALAKVPADRFTTAAEFAAALSANSDTTPTHAPPAGGGLSPQPRPSATRKRLIASLVVLLAVVIAAAITLLNWNESASKTLDPERIVVAPFDAVSVPVKALGEGLVEYLSRSLDGAGPLRTASPSAYLRNWRGRADLASARALGTRTGSGLVVYGELAMAGRDSVRLRAALLDAGNANAPEEFEVRGDTARIDLLADSITVAVLRTIGRNRPVGVVRSTPFGRASIPALKEFLRGERFYRRSRWDSALVHYDRSIGLDTAFALPYRRMYLVQSWAWSPAYEDLATYAWKAAVRNRGLAPRDSLLITADSLLYMLDLDSGYFRNRRLLFATLEEATRRYPGDPETWLALGEARHHDGIYSEEHRETLPPSVLEAFDRAIKLDSGFAPAYEHAIYYALAVGRHDLAQRYTREVLSVPATDSSLEKFRLLDLLLDPARSGTPESLRAIEKASGNTLFEIGYALLAWPDTAETAVQVFRQFASNRPSMAGLPRSFTDSLFRRSVLAAALTQRGHLREAYATHPQPRGGRFNPFTDLALIGTAPADSATAYFRGALAHDSLWLPRVTPGGREALRWWFSQRDTASIVKLMRRADVAHRAHEDPIAGVLLAYLGDAASGYLALIRGDSTQALRRLSSLPDSLCRLDTCFFERLTCAQLLAAGGRDREAIQVLDRWLQKRPWSPFAVLGALEQGHIAERLHQREKALQSYQLVVDLWRRPDSELMPHVVEARAGLRRLTGEAGR